jgi:sulfotransferase family protein
LATVEVLRVSLADRTPELSGFSIDAPSEAAEQGALANDPRVDPPRPLANWAGSRREGYVLHLRGWVVASESRVSSVEVLYEGGVIRRTPVRGSRPDLAAVAPPETDAVFHVLVGVLGLAPEFELELQAVLEDGARVRLGSVKARHTPIGPQLERRLEPITVSCLGRTGSTWLMQILADHPKIVVYRRHPYESAPAGYWAHMLKVLAEPGNVVEGDYRHQFHENLSSIGHNPYYDDTVDDEGGLGQWFASGYVERLAAFCQQSIDDWYASVAEKQGQRETAYFAEKHMWPTYVPVLLRELYPGAKEVFLVRDFRDMACSILDFDERRGYAGFRRPDGKTDEQYVEQDLRRAALALMNGWRHRRETGHLVRYEDLVRRPEETLASLLEYLELDSSASAVASLVGATGETGADRDHGTSSSLDASVGRWERERDAKFRALCNEAFAEALAEFGYA